MTGLIHELQEQHARLVSILEVAKAHGFASQETQDMLREARTGLLDHLRKEDIELYPVLKVAAMTNSSIKEILDMFSVDMADTLKLAVVFFKKCEQAGAGLDLATDGGHLLALLRIRIRREEELLYPLYESLAKKAA